MVPDHLIDDGSRARREHEAGEAVDQHQEEPERQTTPVRVHQRAGFLHGPRSEGLLFGLCCNGIRHEVKSNPVGVGSREWFLSLATGPPFARLEPLPTPCS